MNKHCYDCKNYCRLINQGIWWCKLQKDINMQKIKMAK